MLIAADRTIVSAILFNMLRTHPYGVFRSQSKSKTVEDFSDRYPNTKIKFQFPPRITSDGRTGSWQEDEMTGDQAISVYKTSSARKMTLEWTYIIGEQGGGGSLTDNSGQAWTAAEIKWNLSGLRAYYTQSFGTGESFIVQFLYGLYGDPGNAFTCRLGSIDMTHKGGLIMENNQGKTVFPLRTDVKVAMQLWTLGAMGIEKGAVDADGKPLADSHGKLIGGLNSTKFEMDGLKKSVTSLPQWE